MRKINFLLVSLLVVASGFFASCTKDDEGTNSFDFAGGTDYISGDATVEAGSTLKFKWTISTSTNMATMDITKNDAYVGGWADFEIPSDSKNTFIKEVTLTADSNPGVYTYEFSVYDKDGLGIISKSVIITVTASSAPISTYTNKTLGGGTSSEGSYLDAESGTVYKSADLTDAVKAKVDIIFDLGTFYNSTTTALFSSGTGTKFKATTISATEFAAMTNDANFPTVTADLNTIQVSANSVIFFVTKAGKKGLIKVNSLTNSTANGVLNIDIKVQQ